MKIKFITNACMLYEYKYFSLLSDPWLTEPIIEGTWFHDPPITTKPEDVLGVGALYISHIHPDHLDENTLKHFRRDIAILTLKDKYSFCLKHLQKLGFTNIYGLEDREDFHLDVGIKFTMFGPFAKHPLHTCEIGNVVDSALLIQADGVKILNTNDNMPSVEAAKWLKEEYGPFDLVQLNYNAAGPYPACFQNFKTDKERFDEAKRMSDMLTKQMIDVATILDAKFTMPFAGQYKLGGPSAHLNDLLGLKTMEQAAQDLTGHGIESLCLAENEEVEFIAGQMRETAPQIKDEVYSLDVLLIKARERLWKAQERFNYYPDLLVIINDYFMFNFKSSGFNFSGGEPYPEPRLKCNIEGHLLERLLTKKVHWNNAELGCLIMFDRQPNEYMPDVHTLMSFFHA